MDLGVESVIKLQEIPRRCFQSFFSNILSSVLKQLVSIYLHVLFFKLNHSHKKRKASLEGSLDRVLFEAELEFPKILVPRLPQHTSNVKTECTGKSEWSKQVYSLYVTSFLEHDTFKFYYSGIISFQLMMSGVNYVIYGSSSGRATPGVSLIIPRLNTGGKYFCCYYSKQNDR